MYKYVPYLPILIQENAWLSTILLIISIGYKQISLTTLKFL